LIALAVPLHPLRQLDQTLDAQLVQAFVQRLARHAGGAGVLGGVPRVRPGGGAFAEDDFEQLGRWIGHRLLKKGVAHAAAHATLGIIGAGPSWLTAPPARGTLWRVPPWTETLRHAPPDHRLDQPGLPRLSAAGLPWRRGGDPGAQTAVAPVAARSGDAR